MKIEQKEWGNLAGQALLKYTLTNESGAYVELCNLGAGIVALGVPDRNGVIDDVVLGYAKAEDYFADAPCSGRCPGRFANRIANGRFSLDGHQYELPINNGPNHLHGGPDGFHNKVWESRICGDDAVEFMYYSPDGEAGYPGNLKVVAHYQWGEDNVLKLTFTAQCDAPTVINLTNHVYFNLEGEGSGSALGHVLKLNASEYLTSDSTLIPYGESVPVAGTPMDFVNEKPLGRGINVDFPALKNGKGYDSTFLVDGHEPGQIQSAAELYAPESGRFLEVLTTQPGVHIYTGNWLEGCPAGKRATYHDYDGVAIECQHFPDSPNKPEFPSTVLRPGETYEQAIIWAFSTK